MILLSTTISRRRAKTLEATSLVLALLVAGCLPKPPAETGGINITLHGFSIWLDVE